MAMAAHQGTKSEIDARNSSFDECKDLGHKLIKQEHPATPQIRDKLQELFQLRNNMVDKWQDKWDWLELSEC